MEWLAQIFRANPVIPIFLTIGLGFWLGQLKYKSFSLGPVAATLIVGVIIGQLGIVIPDLVKTVFFILFLFSIGYSVGPQFFQAFRGQGIKQVIFALIEALVCAGTVIAASKIMGYHPGIALGLFAGSQTVSASLGVSTETLRNLALAPDVKEHFLAMIPACYAVTYVFGTIGSAWFLSNIAPMFMGGIDSVRQEAAAIEAEMDSGEFVAEAGSIVANRPVSIRSYQAESEFFDAPKTVGQLEAAFAAQGKRIFVDRLRINGEICEPAPKLRIKKGDIVVLTARRETMVESGDFVGPEVADHELLSFGVENLPVTVSRTGAAGMTFGELRRRPWMKGVLVRSITRNNVAVPALTKTRLEAGDVLTLVGLEDVVAQAVSKIGYADRRTNITDMVFLGLGIALGAFVGSIAVHINGIPLALSASGGAMLAGLCLGWFRNAHPTFGRIPEPVVWIFDNLGLNMFIAVIGISSGTSFVAGLKEVGVGLFIVGVICTLVGLCVNIFIARKIFHFSAPETLGCVAGARCGIASIGAIQDAVESKVPALGYAVTYAVANLALVFSSLLVLFSL